MRIIYKVSSMIFLITIFLLKEQSHSSRHQKIFLSTPVKNTVLSLKKSAQRASCRKTTQRALKIGMDAAGLVFLNERVLRSETREAKSARMLTLRLSYSENA